MFGLLLNMVTDGTGSSRKWALLLASGLFLSLFALIYPVYVIQPFRQQGPRELQFALAVIRWRPIAMLAAAAVALAGLTGYWRTVGRPWGRRIAVAAALLTLAAAGVSRINIYELMFHPVDRPEFTTAAESKLDGAEMVLAIRIRDEARAYPIRSISYHHVVNDRLGGVPGVPIVATY
jgi:hypothetical protein